MHQAWGRSESGKKVVSKRRRWIRRTLAVGEGVDLLRLSRFAGQRSRQTVVVRCLEGEQQRWQIDRSVRAGIAPSTRLGITETAWGESDGARIAAVHQLLPILVLVI